MGLLASRGALADAEDTFNIVPGVSVTHDDNFNRGPSSLAASDDITTSSLAFKLNKAYSLQRFELEASYVEQRYKTYSQNNYDATPYKAAWHWSLTPYLHGKLSADSVKMPFNDYADDPNSLSGSRTTRNLTTIENTRFDAVLDLNPSWHLLGGVSDYTKKYSEITTGNLNSNTTRAEAGIRYTTSSGNTLSYILHSGRGEYFDLPLALSPFKNTAPFDDVENELRLQWLLTAKTSLNAVLFHLQRKYTDASIGDFDFSGNGGNIGMNWAITAKTSLSATISRQLSAYTASDASYTRTDRFALASSWKTSAKTALRASLAYSLRDYLGSPLGTNSGRTDTLRSGMLSFEWQALRNATLAASLQTEKQTSTNTLVDLDYDRNRVSVTADIAF